MTWKQLPSLALGNECGRVSRGYSNCWRLQRLLEATATVGSCGNCWKLRRLLEAATGCRRGPQYDGKCSFYLIHIFSAQLQQTETSDRKLFIFHLGSRAIFRDPEILYIIRRTCCTSQGDPDSSFPCGL